tara:strand:+ start:1396 stop:2508 length:1113 start_codon:yes stop_codon:yes gene_type:complete
MNDESAFMQHAIDIAEKGIGRVSPNPPVGCILVQGDRIIAEGWHNQIGDLHAEQAAIADAEKRGENTEGCIAFVTLEPCNHFGRTPPCTQALLWAGVSKVVIASRDPNPNVRGKGIDALIDAGIEVEIGIQKTKAEAQMQAFLNWCEFRRPLVTLKMAVDANDKVDDRNAPARRFTTESSLQFAHALRRQCDAILVGSQTVIRDDPSLTIRKVDSDGSSNPTRIILDTRGEIDKDASVWNNDATTLRIVGQNKCDEIQGIESISMPTVTESKKPDDLLDLLGDRGIQELLIEGGPSVWTSFLENGVVDRIIHIRSDIEFVEGPEMKLTDRLLSLNQLELIDERKETGDTIQIFTRGGRTLPHQRWPYPSD